jgi:F0F1-type ATP synthase delta subunit
MKDNYIKAALELVEAGTPVETLLQNMKQVMDRRGHASLHAAVLNGLILALEAKVQSQVPTVVIAKSDSDALSRVESALAVLGHKAKDYRTVIDPSIVGGVIVSHNYKTIDQSYKTKLNNLYQSIIS